MNFYSHQDSVVTRTVELVNATTPGLRRGRWYPQPRGAELVDMIRGALSNAQNIDVAQADKLAFWARRLRCVFEDFDRGHLDAAAGAVNAVLGELRPTPYLDPTTASPGICTSGAATTISPTAGRGRTR